ncbi:MAG: ribosome small subunit-dependent GTPase A, partial [Cellulomonadaceae bacterium]|nr:ribosome small subunit-dependent GTPase A [Cellulomonadaceae bacterium]
MAIGNKRQLDEESGFDRPSKRGSRPRTKQRPGHEDATLAMVVAVDRGRYTLAVDGDLSVTAMKARELRDRIVVGDKVAVVGDVTGNPDALARIVRIEPRTSVLRRTADDTDPFERIVVANADQLVIVVACANPEPRVGMIDRAVVAAYDAGM